jgi:hypothetical protein
VLPASRSNRPTASSPPKACTRAISTAVSEQEKWFPRAAALRAGRVVDSSIV